MIEYPTFAELQAAGPSRPAGTSWGVFSTPGRGSASFATPSAAVSAASLIVEGESFGLDYALDAFDPGMSVKREKPRHVVYSGHPCHRDDYLDGFYLQGSTQVDALRHRRSDEVGFYEGVDDEGIVAGSPALGVQEWAERPIVGRGVLVDLARHATVVGAPIDHVAGEALSFDFVQEAMGVQGIVLRPGDIVMLRTGWAEWFLALSEEERRAHARTRRATGIRQQVEFPQWAWDSGLSLLASDTFAVERLPVVPASPYLETAPDDEGMMHQELLAKLGIPLGELWRLGPLADALAARDRHCCFVTVKPLNLIGGTGSPANATAIL